MICLVMLIKVDIFVFDKKNVISKQSREGSLDNTCYIKILKKSLMIPKVVKKVRKPSQTSFMSRLVHGLTASHSPFTLELLFGNFLELLGFIC